MIVQWAGFPERHTECTYYIVADNINSSRRGKSAKSGVNKSARNLRYLTAVRCNNPTAQDLPAA
jgi:hypothetical protein